MTPPDAARTTDTRADDRRAATVSIWHRVGHNPRTLAPTFPGTGVPRPLLKVFEYRHTPPADTTDPLRRVFACAEHAFLIGNVDPDHLDGTDAQLAAAYRARRLRSLSVGDVVVVGEVPLHCLPAGWEVLEGDFPQANHGLPGSTPWTEQPPPDVTA